MLSDDEFSPGVPSNSLRKHSYFSVHNRLCKSTRATAFMWEPPYKFENNPVLSCDPQEQAEAELTAHVEDPSTGWSTPTKDATNRKIHMGHTILFQVQVVLRQSPRFLSQAFRLWACVTAHNVFNPLSLVFFSGARQNYGKKNRST